MECTQNMWRALLILQTTLAEDGVNHWEGRQEWHKERNARSVIIRKILTSRGNRRTFHTLQLSLENIRHSFLLEDEAQSCLAQRLLGRGLTLGQQLLAVLRDEISVHVPSSEVRVASQAEEEVNVGLQPDNLGRESSPRPRWVGKTRFSAFAWLLRLC